MRIRSLYNTYKLWYNKNVRGTIRKWLDKYEAWRVERDVKSICANKRRFKRNKDGTISEYLGTRLINKNVPRVEQVGYKK